MLAPELFYIVPSTTHYIFPQKEHTGSKNWHNRGTYRIERRHLDDPLKPYLAPIRNVPSFHLPVGDFSGVYPDVKISSGYFPTPSITYQPKLEQSPGPAPTPSPRHSPDVLAPQRGSARILKKNLAETRASAIQVARGRSAMNLKLVLNETPIISGGVLKKTKQPRRSTQKQSRPPKASVPMRAKSTPIPSDQCALEVTRLSYPTTEERTHYPTNPQNTDPLPQRGQVAKVQSMEEPYRQQKSQVSEGNPDQLRIVVKSEEADQGWDYFRRYD
ncbi:hypothetical protein DFH27DRAFT_176471 [Peziza echinospora]|nr:hypothetical protein DFH27DRAFT_176471 [Peziza echinospora]